MQKKCVALLMMLCLQSSAKCRRDQIIGIVSSTGTGKLGKQVQFAGCSGRPFTERQCIPRQYTQNANFYIYSENRLALKVSMLEILG